MVQRYENDYGDIIESKDGALVTYADYEELERSGRAVTDVMMLPRIEGIESFTPRQVEDMWMYRVKWLCSHLGVRIHDDMGEE